jgi:hypothetical protein
MTNILSTPVVYLYTIANHLEFNKTSLKICDGHAGEINAPELLADYRDKVIREENNYKWSRSSAFTEKKVEVDHERDTILSGVSGYLHSLEKHFDPATRDNAKHVLKLIDNYGDLAHAGYDAETAGIDSILAKLNGVDYLFAVQSLHLEPWLTELARLNNLFKGYAADTEQEEVKKPEVSFKVARQETDRALRRITTRVTSLVDLYGPDSYLQFVAEFNIHVDHYNTLVHEHYGRLHARIDISGADIDPIAVQAFKGKPVYVIPVVKVSRKDKDGVTTIVELRFSEDFTVGYKNNAAPGTATLIITGTGKYTGEIVTTFKING